ncbi:MAG: MATE family efflux transporter [Prevotella sp.]|nr:MATE family efflux transporter [Prevotella sp.]
MRFRLHDRQILNLAIPAIVSNITVPLLGLVDLAIVGHIGNETLIGAIAIGSMIFNVIYWVFGFLRMGTSGLTAQALGRGDALAIRSLLAQSLMIGFSIALVFIVFQIPIRWIAITVMHPSADIIPQVCSYFNICIYGAPAMLCLYGISGWFIGMQDTRSPMVVSISQNVINILASFVLVFGFGMKIEGVAYGTLIAQWCGLVLALCLLKGKRGFLQSESVHSFDYSLMSFMSFLKVNRDIFLRTLFLVAVFLFFTSAGARQGDMVLSVNTLLMTFFTLFSYFMDGFAFAGEALCGKTFGANDRGSFHAICRRLFGWGCVMVIVFTLAYAVGGLSFLHLLTDQQKVITAAQVYFPWVLVIPTMGMAAFVYDGIFIGITATRGMLITCALASVVFFLLYILLFPTMGNHALWLALVTYLALRGIFQHLYIRKMVSL